MSSETTSDFAYRMSWFSDSPGLDETLLGCIIGGGNKDVEFAMKYRQYMPADSAVMDSACMYDQVFGPNYSEGTGLISDYDAYLSGCFDDAWRFQGRGNLLRHGAVQQPTPCPAQGLKKERERHTQPTSPWQI